jgi:hypothetical protein
MFVPHRKHISLHYEANRLMRSIGLWRLYINITITILAFIHRWTMPTTMIFTQRLKWCLLYYPGVTNLKSTVYGILWIPGHSLVFDVVDVRQKLGEFCVTSRCLITILIILVFRLSKKYSDSTQTQCTTIYVRFEVFTAVTMKNGVFWDVTPCDSC